MEEERERIEERKRKLESRPLKDGAKMMKIEINGVIYLLTAL